MNDLEKLHKYLLSEDISKYENEIFEIIPELKYEKNFDQRNEWHCYDVWGHTLATLKVCDNNFENRLVMLLHDIGKPFSYQNDGEKRHFKNHANKSAEMSREILDRLNVPYTNKEMILKLIEMHATRIEVSKVSSKDVSFYSRLLKIQKCDAHGYEQNHSLQILEQLNLTEKKLNEIAMKKEDFER